MPTTFFIGDTHLGHKNIIIFEPLYRPFATIEEHDEKLIDNWNSVVGKNDIVYHLGDAVFGKGNIHKLGRLNGTKKLIMGNHDCYATVEYLKYFTKLHGILYYEGRVILSHVPVHEKQVSGQRFKHNIHGHLHSKAVLKHTGNIELIDPRYINVSCEQINLTPISYDELKLRMV